MCFCAVEMDLDRKNADNGGPAAHVGAVFKPFPLPSEHTHCHAINKTSPIAKSYGAYA